jgi:hypothetical protein
MTNHSLKIPSTEFHENPSIGMEFFCGNRWTEGQTNMKLVVSFAIAMRTHLKITASTKKPQAAMHSHTTTIYYYFQVTFQLPVSLSLASNPFLGSWPDLSFTGVSCVSQKSQFFVSWTYNNCTLFLMHSLTPLQYTAYKTTVNLDFVQLIMRYLTWSMLQCHFIHFIGLTHNCRQLPPSCQCNRQNSWDIF